MKVQDIMTREVRCCGPEMNLAEAAKLMWDGDCGILPIINQDKRVIGMITDRDICMAVATKGRHPSEITVWETSTGTVYSVKPQDDIHDALKVMAANRVRRLPVVDEDGRLVGLLAVNDVILHAEDEKGKKAVDLPYEAVINTLKAICAHRQLASAP